MKKVAISLMAWVAALQMNAVPANPKPFTYTQPDGTSVVLTLVGDEYSHTYIDGQGRAVDIYDDGYVRVVATSGIQYVRQNRVLALDARKQKGRNVKMRLSKAATTGEVHGLIILVNFDDLKFTNTKEFIHNQMNVGGFCENGATGSARDYFITQSSGQFSPIFDVVGPVTLDMPYRYYGGNDAKGSDRHADAMVFSAVQKAVEQGLDLDKYDADSNGIVDMVYVIYA